MTGEAAHARGPLAPYWLVLDMDGTLVPTPSKAGGHYEPLSHSPCYQPVREWLREGGNLCVVSTAGQRMWRQIFDDVRDVLAAPSAGQLAIAPFGGTVLFRTEARSSFGHSRLVEDESYRLHAVEGGTVISAEATQVVTDLFAHKFHRLFELAAADSQVIAALSRKYQQPYQRLVETRKTMHPARFNEAVLSKEVLLKRGAVITDGPRGAASRMVAIQEIPDVVDANGVPVTAQVSMLGVPMRFFGDVFAAEDIRLLHGLGLKIVSQPNSVVVSHAGINKALAVKWLDKHGELYNGFTLRRAYAGGDAPASVDQPLTLFPSMPFVSFSPSAEHDARACCPHLYRVGGEEHGCAIFIDHLTKDLMRRGRINAETFSSWGVLQELILPAQPSPHLTSPTTG